MYKSLAIKWNFVQSLHTGTYRFEIKTAGDKKLKGA